MCFRLQTKTYLTCYQDVTKNALALKQKVSQLEKLLSQKESRAKGSPKVALPSKERQAMAHRIAELEGLHRSKENELERMADRMNRIMEKMEHEKDSIMVQIESTSSQNAELSALLEEREREIEDLRHRLELSSSQQYQAHHVPATSLPLSSKNPFL